jgi:hypothetical protein
MTGGDPSGGTRPLHPQDLAQLVDVVVGRAGNARRPPRRDQALVFEEPDLRDGDGGEPSALTCNTVPIVTRE